MSELHTCPGCCGRFQCAAFAALRERDETIARLTAAVEARDAAVREYLAAQDEIDHGGALFFGRLNAAEDALRAIVVSDGGDRG